jgi:hypothetical protein
LGVVKRCWTLGLMFELLCGGQSLTIRLYNLANVPGETLERASDVAGELLAGAAVKAIWEKGPPDSLEGRLTVMIPSSIPSAPDDRGYVVVRIEEGMPGRVSGADLGYALPFAREGVHATVFYNRIEKLCLGPMANLLGAAMAHEIGHVLLGSTEHSATGIMKARWGQAEFQLLACHRLQFTPEDREAIAQKRSEWLERFSSAQHRLTASEIAIGWRHCSAGR